MAREQDFITEARASARKMWEAHNELLALQREYTAMDFANNLPDGEGENADITAAEISAVVINTANAMTTMLGTGHATNIAKVL